MKIQYWVAGRVGSNTINFSVTGEGSIEEECKQDARVKAIEQNPYVKNIIELQQVAILQK